MDTYLKWVVENTRTQWWHDSADPVELPRRYRDPADAGVAGLVASCLAYGRADLFKPVVERILGEMGPSPARFAEAFARAPDPGAFGDAVYRFNRPADVRALVAAIGHVRRAHGSLGARFSALFHEEGLTFTKGLCASDEPDIWVKTGDGRVQFWVEVGLPDAERIVKASRHAERVALLACGRSFHSWRQQHLPRLSGIANLTVVSVDQQFLASLVERLERSISWSITITEGVCYLAIADETLETAIRTSGN